MFYVKRQGFKYIQQGIIKNLILPKNIVARFISFEGKNYLKGFFMSYYIKLLLRICFY